MVVLHGCQGADTEAEELALTEQLFDAALGELAWQKGFRLGSGLILKLLGLWLVVSNLLLLASVLGMPVVVTGPAWQVGCPTSCCSDLSDLV